MCKPMILSASCRNVYIKVLVRFVSQCIETQDIFFTLRTSTSRNNDTFSFPQLANILPLATYDTFRIKDDDTFNCLDMKIITHIDCIENNMT